MISSQGSELKLIPDASYCQHLFPKILGFAKKRLLLLTCDCANLDNRYFVL